MMIGKLDFLTDLHILTICVVPGIPICWPAFAQPEPNGPFSKLALHGFARQQVWKYHKTDSPAKAIFSWFHHFLDFYNLVAIAY